MAKYQVTPEDLEANSDLYGSATDYMGQRQRTLRKAALKGIGEAAKPGSYEPGLSAAEKMAMQERLTGQLAAMQDAKARTAGAKVAASQSRQEALFDSKMKLVEMIYETSTDAEAKLAAAKIMAGGSTHSELARDKRGLMGVDTLSDPAQRAVNDLDSQLSQLNLSRSDAKTQVRQLVTSVSNEISSIGDPRERAKVLIAIETRLGELGAERGGQPFSLIEEVKRSTDPSGPWGNLKQTLIKGEPLIQGDLAKLAQIDEEMEKIRKDMTRAGVNSGVSELAEIMSGVDALYGAAEGTAVEGVEGGVEGVDEGVDDEGVEGADEGDTAESKIEKMLAQLESGDMTPPLIAARNAVVESEKFKAWAAARGYTDEGMAFRQLMKEARAGRRMNKQDTREAIRRGRKTEGVDPRTGKLSPSTEAEEIAAEAGKEPSPSASLVQGSEAARAQPAKTTPSRSGSSQASSSKASSSQAGSREDYPEDLYFKEIKSELPTTGLPDFLRASPGEEFTGRRDEVTVTEELPKEPLVNRALKAPYKALGGAVDLGTSTTKDLRSTRDWAGENVPLAWAPVSVASQADKALGIPALQDKVSGQIRAGLARGETDIDKLANWYQQSKRKALDSSK